MKLNVFKDSMSIHDTDDCPKERHDERCLNCNKEFNDHHNWACEMKHVSVYFYGLGTTEKYMTISMLTSLGSYIPSHLDGYKYGYLYMAEPIVAEVIQPKVTVEVQSSFLGPDLSDWRVWARVRPGYCPCNVPKHQCPDHRDR